MTRAEAKRAARLSEAIEGCDELANELAKAGESERLELAIIDDEGTFLHAGVPIRPALAARVVALARAEFVDALTALGVEP